MVSFRKQAIFLISADTLFLIRKLTREGGIMDDARPAREALNIDLTLIIRMRLLGQRVVGDVLLLLILQLGRGNRLILVAIRELDGFIERRFET